MSATYTFFVAVIISVRDSFLKPWTTHGSDYNRKAMEHNPTRIWGSNMNI